MKRWMGVVALVALAVAVDAEAQVNVARVAEDAIVLDRVAEMSRKDLPKDLLKRMVTEDIEILRGIRPDGSYQYATWERLEGGRKTDTFSVQPRGEKARRIEMSGTWIYRVIIDSPGRRLLVAKNRPVQLDRVDIEYIPAGSTVAKVHSVPIGAPLVPGTNHPIDLPEIARQATVRVTARTEEQTGYGNINISLVQARIVDNANSPYAEAVASEKAVLRALDNVDVPSIRAMAARIRESLGAPSTPPTPRVVEVVAPRVEAAPSPNLHGELEAIEDLLTGTESERREGLDKLHQLVRRMRPR